MKEVVGKYAKAKIFTNLVEESAIEQIKLLCDQPFVKDCTIRVMPDVHSGAECVIGFTADLGPIVIPNIVGVDLGCGMLVVLLGKVDIDLGKLDQIIYKNIPSGMNVYDESVCEFESLSDLYCFKELKNLDWIKNSIGTLGGGNHFIEVDVDDLGNKYLVIHTGSRNLGKQVAEYYQQVAYDTLQGKYYINNQRKALVEKYKKEGRVKEISAALKEFNESNKVNDTPKELCYLVGENRDAYLHDMKICQEFAVLNRKTIANRILKELLGLELDQFEWFETIHNYIDFDSNIIRKGAVSAKLNEKLLIPINMRDGGLICIGKGNEDWNCSAPHGAGRLMSRAKAKQLLDVETFVSEMKDVYTTCVGYDTLDESPMAYKPMESILDNIKPTVDVVCVIKPVYNFKAS